MPVFISIKKPKSEDFIDVIIDDCDGWVNKWQWCSWRGIRNTGLYAVRGIRTGNKTFQLHLSRLIAGALPRERVEHLDGNSLNNRRQNLLVDGVCVLDLKDRQPITEDNFQQYLSVFL